VCPGASTARLREAPTAAQIEAAARGSNAHGFITARFPQGYATLVGAQGQPALTANRCRGWASAACASLPAHADR
jgi:ABC-type protease/lipase transport system fused ATPase/permease subunit